MGPQRARRPSPSDVLLYDFLCDGLDLLRVIDVQLDGVDSRIGPGNLIQQGLATARDDDLIAALVKCLGQSAANAGSAAGER